MHRAMIWSFHSVQLHDCCCEAGAAWSLLDWNSSHDCGPWRGAGLCWEAKGVFNISLCLVPSTFYICTFQLLYSWKISRDPIFEDFEVICLTLKILSSDFSSQELFATPTSISIHVYTRSSVLSACTANNEANNYDQFAGCGLAATVDCGS